MGTQVSGSVVVDSLFIVAPIDFGSSVFGPCFVGCFTLIVLVMSFDY